MEVIHVVTTDCRPEFEDKFNKWYDEVHIPMLFKLKGLREVTRYKLWVEVEEHPKYLTIYKFESEEAYAAYLASPEKAAAGKEMIETWRGGGWEVKGRRQYVPMRSWKK